MSFPKINTSIIDQRKTLIIALISTLIMILYASIVLGNKSACFQEQIGQDMRVFGLHFGYDLDYALKFFSSLNESGLHCYKIFTQIWDTIFPILYGLMYISWYVYLLKNSGLSKSKWKILRFYPLFPVLLDWLENIAELRMLTYFQKYNGLNDEIVQTASTISQIKWFSSSVNYLVILILIGQIINKKIFKN